MPRVTRSTATKRRLNFEEPDDTGATTPQKRGIQSKLSPKKKDTLSTPAKKARVEVREEESYVPKYIHKNVEYARKGESSISANMKKTFSLIQLHFRLPEDLETNGKYGPLSGTCFEERAIIAYSMGELEVKNPESDGIQICTACATVGHKRDCCPTLI